MKPCIVDDTFVDILMDNFTKVIDLQFAYF